VDDSAAADLPGAGLAALGAALPDAVELSRLYSCQRGKSLIITSTGPLLSGLRLTT
jgi:hypothetical protein